MAEVCKNEGQMIRLLKAEPETNMQVSRRYPELCAQKLCDFALQCPIWIRDFSPGRSLTLS